MAGGCAGMCSPSAHRSAQKHSPQTHQSCLSLVLPCALVHAGGLCLWVTAGSWQRCTAGKHYQLQLHHQGKAGQVRRGEEK